MIGGSTGLSRSRRIASSSSLIGEGERGISTSELRVLTDAVFRARVPRGGRTIKL